MSQLHTLTIFILYSFRYLLFVRYILPDLKFICQVMCLDNFGQKEKIIDRVLDFLLCPTDEHVKKRKKRTLSTNSEANTTLDGDDNQELVEPEESLATAIVVTGGKTPANRRSKTGTLVEDARTDSTGESDKMPTGQGRNVARKGSNPVKKKIKADLGEFKEQEQPEPSKELGRKPRSSARKSKTRGVKRKLEAVLTNSVSSRAGGEDPSDSQEQAQVEPTPELDRKPRSSKRKSKTPVKRKFNAELTSSADKDGPTDSQEQAQPESSPELVKKPKSSARKSKTPVKRKFNAELTSSVSSVADQDGPADSQEQVEPEPSQELARKPKSSARKSKTPVKMKFNAELTSSVSSGADEDGPTDSQEQAHFEPSPELAKKPKSSARKSKTPVKRKVEPDLVLEPSPEKKSKKTPVAAPLDLPELPPAVPGKKKSAGRSKIKPEMASTLNGRVADVKRRKKSKIAAGSKFKVTALAPADDGALTGKGSDDGCETPARSPAQESAFIQPVVLDEGDGADPPESGGSVDDEAPPLEPKVSESLGCAAHPESGGSVDHEALPLGSKVAKSLAGIGTLTGDSGSCDDREIGDVAIGRGKEGSVPMVEELVGAQIGLDSILPCLAINPVMEGDSNKENLPAEGQIVGPVAPVDEEFAKDVIGQLAELPSTEHAAEELIEADPVAEQLSEVSTDSVTEQLSESSTEPVAEQLTEPPTKHAAEQLSQPSTENASKQLSEPSTEPVAEKLTETSTEHAAEKLVEPSNGPVVEQLAKPSTENAAEQLSEPSTGPVAEQMAEPSTGSVAEQLAEPSTEPVAEQLSEPSKELLAEKLAEPSTGPVAEQLAEPSTGSVAEQLAEPVAEQLSEPSKELLVEKLVEPSTEPVAEQLAEPSTGSVAEQLAEPSTEPLPGQLAEPSTEPVVEQLAEPSTRPVAEQLTEPSTGTVAEQLSEPSTEPVNGQLPETEPEQVEPSTEQLPETEPEKLALAEPGIEHLIEPISKQLDKSSTEQSTEHLAGCADPTTNEVTKGSVVLDPAHIATIATSHQNCAGPDHVGQLSHPEPCQVSADLVPQDPALQTTESQPLSVKPATNHNNLTQDPTPADAQHLTNPDPQNRSQPALPTVRYKANSRIRNFQQNFL